MSTDSKILHFQNKKRDKTGTNIIKVNLDKSLTLKMIHASLKGTLNIF